MRIIYLTRGAVAMVDDCDYPRLSAVSWCLDITKSGIFYAYRKSPDGKTLRMHQEIVGKSEGMVVDHIDGNGLNNTRSNLRLVSRSVNALNSRNSKGYYFEKSRNKYVCRVSVGDKTHFLGRFSVEADATYVVSQFKRNLMSDLEVRK